MAIPTRLVGKVYKDLTGFAAWQRWDFPGRQKHTNDNDLYIPVKGVQPKAFDYPAELKKMIEHGWRSAKKPTAARPASAPLIGRTRPGAEPNAEPCLADHTSQLRWAFGRDMASDWGHMNLFKHVSAYAFRGDSRPPEQVRAGGGFSPPSMRMDVQFKGVIAKEFTQYARRKGWFKQDSEEAMAVEEALRDYLIHKVRPEDGALLAEYHFWRQVLTNERMHLRGMTESSFLRAYVSTTRDPWFANEAAGGIMGGAAAPESALNSSDGWVYVVKVNSGFLLKTGVGGIETDEAEIAHLGRIPWQDVIGFIRVGRGAERLVYVRNCFERQDDNAMRHILGSLSEISKPT